MNPRRENEIIQRKHSIKKSSRPNTALEALILRGSGKKGHEEDRQASE